MQLADLIEECPDGLSYHAMSALEQTAGGLPARFRSISLRWIVPR
ncbi:hypothetical protein RE6C_00208 [Rhodopirellula europaea 6C]|uniref:Uncharacterized protein n=1 Tax=Rhodopirellula europaea 6C TaxID=1263867 RepID=M2APT2_9BACT|nr:hypothetical protein RE6C_00208 [Rhodopirellula europaea 6C]